METKRSKIITVEMLPEWSNSYGTFYPHKCTFENGDVAITNKAKQNAFNEGQELNYQITGQDNSGNNKFKEIQEEQRQSGKSQSSNPSFALSYAKDLAVAHINNGNDFDSKAILTVAEKFNDWLNQH